MQKKWIMFLATMLSLPLALADGVTDTLLSVWDKIISVGSLSVLGLSDGAVVTGLTRILIWVLMFTIFFSVMTGLGGKSGSAPFRFFSRGQAGVIAAVIATISAIFMPDVVLGATGVGWATAVSLFLIGGPIVGLGALLHYIPGKGNETKLTVTIKFLLCLLMFWILSAMKVHITHLGI